MLELSVWENNAITRKEDSVFTNRVFGENNKVFISGKLEAEFEYGYKEKRKRFFRNRVIVERLSETKDFIPIMVPEYLLGNNKDEMKGKWVEIYGQLRTWNEVIDKKKKRSHLRVFLMVTEINIYDDEGEALEIINGNWSYYDGYICKPPVIRTTPSGKEITDVILAVNRDNKLNSDYIPCIVWSHEEGETKDFKVGTHLKFYGRIQSRTYFKDDPKDPSKKIEKTAYEVSVMRMLSIDDVSCFEKK